MESCSSQTDSPLSTRNPNPSFFSAEKRTMEQQRKEEEGEAWPRKSKTKGGGGVLLEGYVDASDCGDQGSDGGDGVGRTKSLTDEDLEELKGCLDLGFGFSYEEIPELCNTLPALELCYSMNQRFSEESCVTSSPSPIANWKISSPGDHPEEVKARLKYWAQAVACTVKLCS